MVLRFYSHSYALNALGMKLFKVFGIPYNSIFHIKARSHGNRICQACKLLQADFYD